MAATQAHGAAPVAKPNRGREGLWVVGWRLHREQTAAERVRAKAEQYRRAASRREKTAADVLAVVQVAAVVAMLK